MNSEKGVNENWESQLIGFSIKIFDNPAIKFYKLLFY